MFRRARCSAENGAIVEQSTLRGVLVTLQWLQGSCLMTLGTLLIILLIVLLIGAVPSWPYSRGWGYYPSGGLGLVLIIVLLLVVFGRI